MWEILERITNVNQVNVSKRERWVSMVAGVILLLYTVIRVPFTVFVALLTAAYLLFRSVRGFCYIYDQINRNTAVQLPKKDGFQDAGPSAAYSSVMTESDTP